MIAFQLGVKLLFRRFNFDREIFFDHRIEFFGRTNLCHMRSEMASSMSTLGIAARVSSHQMSSLILTETRSHQIKMSKQTLLLLIEGRIGRNRLSFERRSSLGEQPWTA